MNQPSLFEAPPTPESGLLVEVALPLPRSQTFTYRIPHDWETPTVGRWVLVPFHRRTLTGVITQVGLEQPPAYAVRCALALLPEWGSLSAEHIDLARWISREYGCSLGEALNAFPSPVQKRRAASHFDLSALQAAGHTPFTPRDLTPHQVAALKEVEPEVGLKAQTFLLHGVTSSGKTEVYLRATAKALERGKTVLFLVPEISLCTPFWQALHARFKDQVGLWHSQITPTQKQNLLKGMRSGAIKIILGARSALFAPLLQLGLIILDEEHDAAYKQEEKPRYVAIQVANQLSKIFSATVILGSATPSLESCYHADRGRYKLLQLPVRISHHKTPTLNIVDRRKLKTRADAALSQPLKEKMIGALARREQIILALNRRGYSTFVICGFCGEVRRCPHCALTLVHHRQKKISEVLKVAGGSVSTEGDYLSCHFCFFEERFPRECAHCKNETLYVGGFGTQKVAELLKKEFPFARILRLDRDSSRRKNAVEEVYRSFHGEKADILIGTQMVVQGFDFPRVTLVGVMDADTALFHPDFRSSERTFQWIVQAVGRAGRSDLGGEAVVQTTLPEHHAIQSALTNDYRRFYETEIKFREKNFYPPFSRLLLLRIESIDSQESVEENAKKLGQSILNCAETDRAQKNIRVEILGPGPCPREKLEKKWRWQILIKIDPSASLQTYIDTARNHLFPASVKLVIDADPYNTL